MLRLVIKFIKLYDLISSSDPSLSKDKKLNTDIWYEEGTFLWVKVADKTGYWEYRLKKSKIANLTLYFFDLANTKYTIFWHFDPKKKNFLYCKMFILRFYLKKKGSSNGRKFQYSLR